MSRVIEAFFFCSIKCEFAKLSPRENKTPATLLRLLCPKKILTRNSVLTLSQVSYPWVFQSPQRLLNSSEFSKSLFQSRCSRKYGFWHEIWEQRYLVSVKRDLYPPKPALSRLPPFSHVPLGPNVDMCLCAVIEMWRWILNQVNTWERWFFCQWNRRKNPNAPNRSRT